MFIAYCWGHQQGEHYISLLLLSESDQFLYTKDQEMRQNKTNIIPPVSLRVPSVKADWYLVTNGNSSQTGCGGQPI